MNKRIKLIVVLALLNNTLTHADTMNLYGAIDAGILRADVSNQYLDQFDVIPQNISGEASQRGYTGGLALGVVHPINSSFFLGLEFSGNLDGNSALYQSGASSTAFSDVMKIHHHLDLALIPGMKTTGSFFPYIKLGISSASLRDELTSPVGYDPVMTTYLASKKVYGFATALGVKHSIKERVGLFAELNYHDYGTVAFSEFQNFSTYYTHSARICTYGAVVGATYDINI